MFAVVPNGRVRTSGRLESREIDARLEDRQPVDSRVRPSSVGRPVRPRAASAYLNDDPDRFVRVPIAVRM
ncbi:hypothetical protein C478_16017 [Natrinema thermotolerans DSM 11552]|nr:hypothetical protein C478_16017 [Natrinema thermotolerans DSM 11552]